MQTDEVNWQPLPAVQRRILGVLIEKAKTTPEQYPLSLNGLTTGCNQKSNRSPVMNVDGEDLEVELDQLRNLGAVVEIQSGGRVAKFKHRMYEWLGVDKLELAVMGELLLRGGQTVGDLRARAARMEAIPDLSALRAVLASLVEKRLVVELTPEGRGQVVTHGLLNEAELKAAREEAASANKPASTTPRDSAPSSTARSTLEKQVNELQRTVEDLLARVTRLESTPTASVGDPPA